MPKFKVLKAIIVEVKQGDEKVAKHYLPGAEVELTDAEAKKFGDRVAGEKLPEPKAEPKAQA